MAPRNDAPSDGTMARRDAARSGRRAPAPDRSILLGSFPMPLRRFWGMALLGLTFWLAGVLALFH